jgi:hypothetical protein
MRRGRPGVVVANTAAMRTRIADPRPPDGLACRTGKLLVAKGSSPARRVIDMLERLALPVPGPRTGVDETFG